MTQDDAGPRRLSKSALWSFIFGILGCVPFICGILAVALGFVGLGATRQPGVRGRWMAVVGLILGLLSLAGWGVASLAAPAMWKAGQAAYTAITAPGRATRDFMQALDAGDEAAAKAHASMSDADLQKAKALIQAQGGFVDTTFNNVQMQTVNGGRGSSHISGTAQFKRRTMSVQADLEDTADGWKVTAIDIEP